MIPFTISKKRVKRAGKGYLKGGRTEMTPERENTLHSNDFLFRGIEGNMEYSNFKLNIVTSLAIKHTSPISKLYLKTVTNSKGTNLQQPKNRG